MNTFHAEEIEDFILGKLDPSRTYQIRLEMETNSLLRDEIDFQKDIIQSIQDNRFAELKALLEATPVPSISPDTVTEEFNTSSPDYKDSYYKTSWASMSASLLISSAALYFQSQTTVNTFPTLRPNGISATFDLDKLKLEPMTTVEITKMPILSEPEPPALVLPKNINKPSFTGTEDESGVLVQEEADIFEDTSAGYSNQLDVVTKKSEQYPFHYQFNGSRLHLFGDFTENPYMLYGNAANGLYLYFENNFYQLETDKTTPTPLKKLSNKQALKLSKIFEVD
ncbi:MAG: hypothetical protein MI784_13220 [Cytophagales bacterium]|nr:hypothetical protein [Cytophagales bacterium]